MRRYKRPNEMYVTHSQGEHFSYVSGFVVSKDWTKMCNEALGIFTTMRPYLSPSLIHKGKKPKRFK